MFMGRLRLHVGLPFSASAFSFLSRCSSCSSFSLLLAFGLVVGAATASEAQAPVVHVATNKPDVRAGEYIELHVDAVIAADAPGDATVTTDRHVGFHADGDDAIGDACSPA